MPKPLAEIVIDEELCSRDELARAVRRSDEERAPLIACLLRECEIDEVTLLATLRRNLRVSVVDPGSASADQEAIRMLPRDVCERLRVLPMSVADYDASSPLLRLAMADPTDAVAIAEVEHHTSCRVEPELMTVSAIEEMIERSYRAFVTEVMKRRPDGSGSESASGKAAEPGARSGGTVPFHRVTDDADLPTRHHALVRVLLRNGVLDEDEYEEEIRAIMKERQE